MGKDFLPEYVNQTVKSGGGTVMMWGVVHLHVVEMVSEHPITNLTEG